ncbi:FBP domain-containing protein [Falsarthrobacter nasiphocae]|uniref:Elongation factor G-binding protein C-terminal treble-clef zinc-finger domain-containing protein n=1 Tax=Falsarthrobacter nasiphocae TaxID=189863 RepID=A0AAE3YGR3_9MICC|nr:FBP domain-containing protein [Falsarthrobacter nasiphocae]MDR6892412.1 hypothetical protein [Falsarthrobacter nasiphocae]
MRALTEKEIRDSLMNCSKGQAKRLNFAQDPAEVDWENTPFLGWGDPKSPLDSYLCAEIDGEAVGLVLRAAAKPSGAATAQMCQMCKSVHAGAGISFMAVPLPGEAGRKGNTAGTYMCQGAACLDYLMGRARLEKSLQMKETLTREEKIERAQENVEAFVRSIRDRG